MHECATDQLQRIKFLSLKNLAELLMRRPQGVRDALAVYCEATEVAGDDAVLWNKLGTLVGGAALAGLMCFRGWRTKTCSSQLGQ